jgi:hypothetical protein
MPGEFGLEKRRNKVLRRSKKSANRHSPFELLKYAISVARNEQNFKRLSTPGHRASDNKNKQTIISEMLR